MESKRFNLNSFLLLLLSAITGVCGWSLAQNVSTVKDDIRQIRTDMIPRHEAAIELESIKAQVQRNDLGIQELRTRVTAVEVDQARRSNK